MSDFPHLIQGLDREAANLKFLLKKSFLVVGSHAFTKTIAFIFKKRSLNCRSLNVLNRLKSFAIMAVEDDGGHGILYLVTIFLRIFCFVIEFCELRWNGLDEHSQFCWNFYESDPRDPR